MRNGVLKLMLALGVIIAGVVLVISVTNLRQTIANARMVEASGLQIMDNRRAIQSVQDTLSSRAAWRGALIRIDAQVDTLARRVSRLENAVYAR